jgi:branched-chain amino acid transport system ATP-binding protein
VTGPAETVPACTGPAGSGLLSIRDLAAGYGDLRAVWDVSIDVHAGHIVALLGMNGAGKTTTLLAVLGLSRVMGGTIELAGKDLRGLPPYDRARLGIGLVQEGKRLFRQRTVEQNLMLGGWTLPRPRRPKLRAALQQAYDRFPVLADRRNEPAGSLSGGQQQMLAVAQALIPRPRVLMLDEPSAGLAPIVVAEVLDVVSGLRAEGIAILLVEQLVDAALEVADHVTVISRGRMAMSVPREAISHRREILDAYLLGEPGSAAAT